MKVINSSCSAIGRAYFCDKLLPVSLKNNQVVSLNDYLDLLHSTREYFKNRAQIDDSNYAQIGLALTEIYSDDMHITRLKQSINNGNSFEIAFNLMLESISYQFTLSNSEFWLERLKDIMAFGRELLALLYNDTRPSIKIQKPYVLFIPFPDRFSWINIDFDGLVGVVLPQISLTSHIIQIFTELNISCCVNYEFHDESLHLEQVQITQNSIVKL